MILQSAMKLLLRVCMGFDEAGTVRRRRAFEMGYIPAITTALDAKFSDENFKMALGANQVIMYEQPKGRADKEMDATWEAEIRKRPALSTQVQRMIGETMRERMRERGLRMLVSAIVHSEPASTGGWSLLMRTTSACAL